MMLFPLRSLVPVFLILASAVSAQTLQEILDAHALPHPAKSNGVEATHTQTDNLLVIEAEDGVGGWEIINEGLSGQAIKSVNNQSMFYYIDFTDPGLYYLYYLASNLDTSSNDAIIRFGGQRLWGENNDGTPNNTSRPDGIRSHARLIFDWDSLPKGPGSHTPDEIKNNSVHVIVPEPGIYALEVRYRSAEYKVDKLVLTTETLSLTQPIQGQQFLAYPGWRRDAHGWFNGSQAPHIYHAFLGWMLKPNPFLSNELYLYPYGMDQWMWTSSAIWPFAYIWGEGWVEFEAPILPEIP